MGQRYNTDIIQIFLWENKEFTVFCWNVIWGNDVIACYNENLFSIISLKLSSVSQVQVMLLLEHAQQSRTAS